MHGQQNIKIYKIYWRKVIMPHKVYKNQVTWCCFLVNFFIAHKAIAVFLSSYRTQAESDIPLRSIWHKLSRKVTADDLRMAITRSLLHSEINFKTQVSRPLNNKITPINLLKLWEIWPSNYIWQSGVVFRPFLLQPLGGQTFSGQISSGVWRCISCQWLPTFGETCAFVCRSRQSEK